MLILLLVRFVFIASVRVGGSTRAPGASGGDTARDERFVLGVDLTDDVFDEFEGEVGEGGFARWRRSRGGWRAHDRMDWGVGVVWRESWELQTGEGSGRGGERRRPAETVKWESEIPRLALGEKRGRFGTQGGLNRWI